MFHNRLLAVLLLLANGSAAFAAAPVTVLESKAARFAPVDVRVDLAQLPDNERQALVRIIHAAKILDGVYMQQISPLNTSTLLQLLNDGSPLGKARLANFLIEKGPWFSLDNNEPFVPGVGAKPPQGNFYPADATRAEVRSFAPTVMPGVPAGTRNAVMCAFFGSRSALVRAITRKSPAVGALVM